MTRILFSSILFVCVAVLISTQRNPITNHNDSSDPGVMRPCPTLQTGFEQNV